MLVTVLRVASLIAFAGPILRTGAVGGPKTDHRARTAVAATEPRSSQTSRPSGCSWPSSPSLLATPTVSEHWCWRCAVAFSQQRGPLSLPGPGPSFGAAWSLVPTTDQGTGLVTTGLYRLIRHPIYLGLSMLAMGQALAFSSWPAVLAVFSAIVPTFVWRAYAEEKLLTEMFGDRYCHYRGQTKMMIPYLL